MSAVADKEVLKLEGVSVSFGGLKAVSDFGISLHESELCGLIGPNGAGKTTVFNLITGVYLPDSGTMDLNGKNLRGLPPHEISKAGIARTFQNIRLYKELTVMDNILVSYHMRKPYGYLDALLRTRK
ncbi:MAG: ATP-binding cassette domain-containing protein, partial [Bdellovibrionaceae bacterium]|nr:ATP-binding cassette domain-containing protein [Pseudobdellovibrionaceae bacterium]